MRKIDSTVLPEQPWLPRIPIGSPAPDPFARRLFISEATVKTHLLHIYAKFGVRDRAAAVAAGFARGLLTRADERPP